MENLLTAVRQRLLILFLIVLTAIIMLSPIAANNVLPNCVDALNHLGAIIQAKMGLEEGQFPLRVMPYLHSGWRYPYYQFYSSTAYLAAGALFMLTPWNPFITFKLIIFLALITGGIYLYRLAYLFVNSRGAAMLASIAYLASPYYLIVLDHMFDFTEAIALGVVPVALYYTLKLFYHPPHAPTFLLMVLAWYLLATIHIVTFFYTFIFLALLVMVFVGMNHRYWRNLLPLAGGFIFAIALAAWCLLPILMIKKFLWVEILYGIDITLDYYSTSLTSLFAPIANIMPRHLAVDRFTNMIFLMRPNIGIPFLFAMAMSLYIFVKQKKINPIADAWLAPLLITAITILLLVWSPMQIWSHLPHTFTVAQYSWRLLAEFSWAAALLFAFSLAWLFPDSAMTKKHLLLGFFCVILATSNWYRFPDLSYYKADFPSIQKKPEIFVVDKTYLPDPAAIPAPMLVSGQNRRLVMPVQLSQQYCQQHKNKTLCHLPSAADAKLIQLPILYYPQLLSILINGKKVSYQGMVDKDKILAVVTTMPNVQNTIEIEFAGLPYANRISDFCWCLWIVLWLYQAMRYITRDRQSI